MLSVAELRHALAAHTERAMESHTVTACPMPGIVYGTAWKKERTAALVHEALQRGFRGIDTACQPKHYDEPAVGVGIAAWLRGGGCREALYVQTKFTSPSGQDPRNIPYDSNAPLAQQIEQSLQVSLSNLGVRYLDGLVLHSPMPTTQQTLSAWRVMEGFIDDGRVKRLGVSNCYELATLEHLFRSARVQPSIVQNRFYADTNYDTDIRAFCRRNGTVYQSFWTLTANPQLLSSSVIGALASAYGRTPAQILFRFLTQAGVVPLTGTTSPDHMREDLAIFDFQLSETECRTVDTLLR
jgi:diketogulonate reductase-like aldo/keto reductase